MADLAEASSSGDANQMEVIQYGPIEERAPTVAPVDDRTYGRVGWSPGDGYKSKDLVDPGSEHVPRIATLLEGQAGRGPARRSEMTIEKERVRKLAAMFQ
jgi:hypothetical protein